MKLSSVLNLSVLSTVAMALYVGLAAVNIYKLMYPLSGVDLAAFHSSKFVKPLWTAEEATMHLRVYLSTKQYFALDFLDKEFDEHNQKDNDVAILWDQQVSQPAFSQSFLLTSCDDDNDDLCANDNNASHQFAVSWLDHAEQVALERGEGGILATLSAAGHGIESTSVLLTAYQALVKQVRQLWVKLGLRAASDQDDTESLDLANILERKTIFFAPESQIWQAVQNNKNLYVHVLLLRHNKGSTLLWPPTDAEKARAAVQNALREHSLLRGQVNMVKHEAPHHIHKPRRYLYKDIVYLYNKYIKHSREMPPWVMAISKPEEYQAYETMQAIKARGETYPYWKPEVAVKFVRDHEAYPLEMAQLSGMPMVRLRPTSEHPTGLAFVPAIHVDEIGLTQEKYIPLNSTVTSLPLRISFDRSDMEHTSARSTTATAGGLSPARWRLLEHLSTALEAQKELGFDQSDIDDVRRLIADTNVLLLSITMLASALHLLFEFLTFRSEVSFWQKNKDLTGLSVQALFMDLFGQTIILLYLIEKESSLLMTVPSGIGCLIALWKCQRASGLTFVPKRTTGAPVAWYNHVPRLFGYELRAMRLEIASAKTNDDNEESKDGNDIRAKDLATLTIESDRMATRYLGAVLLPFVVGYIIYSVLYEEHVSWVGWAISSAASAVYALGFVMMTPQLFLNWKLKSVAHLPWRVLIYKSLNTFIDDLFSFIIRMPTMARISCFRDDIVFFIYLYQRWLYPVDESRPVEGGDGEEGPSVVAGKATKEKKNQ